MWGPHQTLESSAPLLEGLYDLLMSSFHQLKAKRDKRHPIQHVKASEITEEASGSSSSIQEMTEQPSSGVLPDGVEIRTDEKRGRGLYATKAYKTGTSQTIYCDDF